MTDDWFSGWGGESTGELLALADRFRIDSLVLAFEEALYQQSQQRELSRGERYVLAVEALEREVNNGGYNQFFFNSSNEFVDVVVEALDAIGCPETARTTRDAIDSLGLTQVTPEAAEAAAADADEELEAALLRCDDRYFDGTEAIADRLFAWIGAHQDEIKLG